MATTYLTPGVYVEEIESGPKPLSAASTAVAAFVGFTARAPRDDPEDPEGRKPRLVTSWSQYEALYGGFVSGTLLPHAVFGYFNNGGSLAYIVRVPHTRPAEEQATLALPAAGDGDSPALQVTLVGEVDGPLQLEVRPASNRDTSGDEEADEAASESEPPFDLRILVDKAPVESYPSVTLGEGPRNVATLVNDLSTLIRLDVTATDTSLVPVEGRYTIEPPAPLPVRLNDTQLAGSETDRTGINGLAIADDVTMLCVPDLASAAAQEDGTVDLDMWKAVQTAMIDHCENQANRMAILDSPPGMTPQKIKEWRSDVAMYDSRFAALYYPWIKVANPGASNGDRALLVPPCGHMAGIWARNDDTRGVWKAPANEVIRGALDVGLQISKNEQGLLNPIGINCTRPFGTRGIRVWGARTLSSDPTWKYINVRRLFNMVEATIMDGTQWAVFEPNDQDLWARVRRTVSSFLGSLWSRGALFGATPDQAFFVKCDADTNTPASIDRGELIIEVGIAPVKPAEFVIFRISQWQGGSAAAE